MWEYKLSSEMPHLAPLKNRENMFWKASVIGRRCTLTSYVYLTVRFRLPLSRAMFENWWDCAQPVIAESPVSYQREIIGTYSSVTLKSTVLATTLQLAGQYSVLKKAFPSNSEAIFPRARQRVRVRHHDRHRVLLADSAILDRKFQ